MKKFVVEHNSKNIVPLRNGEFEITMPAPGELYISGRAVNKLAEYEAIPAPGTKVYIIDFPLKSERDSIFECSVEAVIWNDVGWFVRARSVVARNLCFDRSLTSRDFYLTLPDAIVAFREMWERSCRT